MNNIISSNQYRDIDGKLFEIKRQLRQQSGYPFEANDLENFLQCAVEGSFYKNVGNKWIEEDKICYFSVTSKGWTGKRWVEFFTSTGVEIGPLTKGLILSDKFKPTKGITYKIAVFRGDFFLDTTRMLSNIFNTAESKEFDILNIEAACLMREYLKDADIRMMGINWVIVLVLGDLNNIIEFSIGTNPIGNHPKIIASSMNFEEEIKYFPNCGFGFNNR